MDDKYPKTIKCEEEGFDIKGVVRKNSDLNCQVELYLPFSTKSGWTKCEYSNWGKRAKQILESAINRKYNAIKLRDYNNKRRFEFFKNIFAKDESEIDFELEYSHGINHKELSDKIGDKTVEEVWKEFEHYQKATKQSDIINNDNFLTKTYLEKMLTTYSCAYCGISMKQIHKLAENKKLFTKRSRGYSLEIDQKDPYGGYSDKNCIASCYWCNNAKTDEFIPKEFKKIAKGINCVWNQRLKDAGLKEMVEFPKNSDIWDK